MSQAATTAGASEITLREPGDDDVQECARICYEAFGEIDEYHRFPRDFPTVEFAAMVIGGWVQHPNVWGVLAECDGKILARIISTSAGRSPASARSRSIQRPRTPASGGG